MARYFDNSEFLVSITIEISSSEVEDNIEYKDKIEEKREKYECHMSGRETKGNLERNEEHDPNGNENDEDIPHISRL